MKFVIIDSANLNRSFVLARDGQIYQVNKYLNFLLGKKIGDTVVLSSGSINSDYYDYIVPYAVKQSFRNDKFFYDFI